MLATFAVTAEHRDVPRQDLLMGLGIVRDIEPSATRSELSMNKRAYAPRILIVTYAGLCLADERANYVVPIDTATRPAVRCLHLRPAGARLKLDAHHPAFGRGRGKRVGPAASRHADRVQYGEWRGYSMPPPLMGFARNLIGEWPIHNIATHGEISYFAQAWAP